MEDCCKAPHVWIGKPIRERSHSLCRELGHYAWAGVPIKRHMTEFRITEDAKLPVGHIFNAAHFVPGQYVDVQGCLSDLESVLATALYLAGWRGRHAVPLSVRSCF